jgi:hypothetical protein
VPSVQSVTRVLAEIAAREAKVQADRGLVRSTVLEVGSQRSRVALSDPAQATKLVNYEGQVITEDHDLAAQHTQLRIAETAATIKGSGERVALVPTGRRQRNLRISLEGPKLDHPPVARNSKSAK